MENNNVKQYLFFDMDGTITPSRQNITPDVYNYLNYLKEAGKKIVIISGQAKDQMLSQIGDCAVDYILAQSGNDSPFWKKIFSEEDKKEVYKHVQKIEENYRGTNILGAKDDLLEDRGSQMSFSFLGHHADVSRKKAFDPLGKWRKSVLEKIPFISSVLECRIAGTTCFDYTYQGHTKGDNIKKLINHLNWDKDQCVYFGDALFPGGNDETVLGVIDTVEVAGPEDLISKLEAITKTNE